MSTVEIKITTEVSRSAARLFLVVVLTLFCAKEMGASGLIVSHDVNTFGTAVAGEEEAKFAVNVAGFLTSGSSRNLLLFESRPGDRSRNFAPSVLGALTNAGFAVTLTSDYSVPFTNYDAIFVSQKFPSAAFLNSAVLVNYVSHGGGVFLAGGVGLSPSIESQGWRDFMNQFGLEFNGSAYNGVSSVSITSTHPIFAGVRTLRCGNGQSIVKVGTYKSAEIIQTVSGQGAYAAVTIADLGTAPRLSVARASNNQVRFEWSTNASGFALESIVNLTGGFLWSPTTNLSLVLDDHFVVTLEITESSRLFRLRKP